MADRASKRSPTRKPKSAARGRVIEEKAAVALDVGLPGRAAPLRASVSPLADPEGVAVLFDEVGR